MKQDRKSAEQVKAITPIHQFTKSGFTLVEIMVVVVVISLIALFAAPEFVNFGPNMRAKAAATDLHTNLQVMKVEAIKQNREAVITFTPVVCPPATYPGGSYSIDINGVSQNYLLPQSTALCESDSLSGGSTAFKFTPIGLWTDNDDNTPAGDTIFQLRNDRTTPRIYKIFVSIAGGISSQKL